MVAFVTRTHRGERPILDGAVLPTSCGMEARRMPGSQRQSGWFGIAAPGQDVARLSAKGAPVADWRGLIPRRFDAMAHWRGLVGQQRVAEVRKPRSMAHESGAMAHKSVRRIQEPATAARKPQVPAVRSKTEVHEPEAMARWCVAKLLKNVGMTGGLLRMAV